MKSTVSRWDGGSRVGDKGWKRKNKEASWVPQADRASIQLRKDKTVIIKQSRRHNPINTRQSILTIRDTLTNKPGQRMDESLAPADLVTSKLTVRCFEEGAPLGTAPGILAVDILARDNGFS